MKRTVSRARLALAVIAMVVAGEERGVNVDRVGDGLAEAVSGEAHVGKSLGVGLRDARVGIGDGLGSGIEIGMGVGMELELELVRYPARWEVGGDKRFK